MILLKIMLTICVNHIKLRLLVIAGQANHWLGESISLKKILFKLEAFASQKEES
jgi:hypothetical protein